VSVFWNFYFGLKVGEDAGIGSGAQSSDFGPLDGASFETGPDRVSPIPAELFAKWWYPKIDPVVRQKLRVCEFCSDLLTIYYNNVAHPL
jgi:hypothetical protein